MRCKHCEGTSFYIPDSKIAPSRCMECGQLCWPASPDPTPPKVRDDIWDTPTTIEDLFWLWDGLPAPKELAE